MQPAQTAPEIEYPESDGKPMAETELHLEWMFRLREILRWRYRGQRVYVGCNMLLYYEQGNPMRSVAPDVFVTFDCDPHRRRIYRTWEEGKAPDVVFEITSHSTRREDERTKPQIFAELGVHEYFLFDPTGDYLDPPLQGFRLNEGEYDRIEPDKTDAVLSQRLDAKLRLEGSHLTFIDLPTGQVLLTETEAQRAAELAARQEAEARRAAELAARQEAETAKLQIAQLQAELEKLRNAAKRDESNP